MMSIIWSAQKINLFPMLKISAKISAKETLSTAQLMTIAFSVIDKLERFNSELISPTDKYLEDSSEDIFFFATFKTDDDLNSFITFMGNYEF